MRNVLASAVKAELNHIYTEPPRFVHGGSDLGWFCREHALHLFVLARLLGRNANVIVGDFALALSDGRLFTSVDDNSDHAWCIIDDILPVDISVFTRYLIPGQPDIGLVFGTETTMGGYSVSYHSGNAEDEVKRSAFEHRPAMAYLEKHHYAFDPIACLTQPFDFLFQPRAGQPTLVDLYGKDIFFQITWHCYRVAIGDAKPLFTFRSPQQAFRAMVKFNPDAREKITETLRH